MGKDSKRDDACPVFERTKDAFRLPLEDYINKFDMCHIEYLVMKSNLV